VSSTQSGLSHQRSHLSRENIAPLTCLAAAPCGSAAHQLALPAMSSEPIEEPLLHRYEQCPVMLPSVTLLSPHQAAKAESSRSVPCCSASPLHGPGHPCTPTKSSTPVALRSSPLHGASWRGSRSVPSCSQGAMPAWPHHCTHRSTRRVEVISVASLLSPSHGASWRGSRSGPCCKADTALLRALLHEVSPGEATTRNERPFVPNVLGEERLEQTLHAFLWVSQRIISSGEPCRLIWLFPLFLLCGRYLKIRVIFSQVRGRERPVSKTA
jgi:hypothetical protein